MPAASHRVAFLCHVGAELADALAYAHGLAD